MNATDKKLEMMIAENCKKYICNKYQFFCRSEFLLNRECDASIFEEKLKESAVKDITKGYGDLKNKKILEIGSGTGGLTVALELAGAMCYGIEPDFYGVTAARQRSNRYGGDSHFVMAVGELMPFKDESFDIAVSFVVIEHVKDVSVILNEINRVLKLGGHLHLFAPNNIWPRDEHFKIFYPHILPKKLGKFYLKLRGKNPAGLDTIHYITPKFLNNMLSKSGYVKIRNLTLERYKEVLMNNSRIENITPMKKLILKCIKILRLNKFFYMLMSLSGLYPAVTFTAKKRNTL